jgi:hypothetical protein
MQPMKRTSTFDRPENPGMNNCNAGVAPSRFKNDRYLAINTHAVHGNGFYSTYTQKL